MVVVSFDDGGGRDLWAQGLGGCNVLAVRRLAQYYKSEVGFMGRDRGGWVRTDLRWFIRRPIADMVGDVW